MKAIKIFLFCIIYCSIISVQKTKDPFTTDVNTIVLMHPNNNLNKEASSFSLVNNGVSKSSFQAVVQLKDDLKQ